MGLRAPFGYVNYEVTFGRLLVKLLDELCSHCHTNDDYEKGCRGCPAGNLIYEIKEYLQYYDESDKRFELYASDEWEQRSGRATSDEQKQKELQIAEDYRPECDVLRQIKPIVKRIRPKPFYFVRGKSAYRRPKVLNDFALLIEEYAVKRASHFAKRGIPTVRV